MSRRPRHWAKVWLDWFDSPSHELIDPRLLGLGAKLLLLATPAQNPYESDASAWLVSPAGEPWPVETIARRLRVQPEEAKCLLDELVKVETMARQGGAYGFPKWWTWQESPDARRKRKEERRKKPPDIPPDIHTECASASASGVGSGGGGVGEGVRLPSPADLEAYPPKPRRDMIVRALIHAAEAAGFFTIGREHHPVKSALERIDSGATPHEVESALWEAIEAKRPREEIRSMFWHRNWSRRKPTGPTHTRESAMAYCEEHGRLPDGWAFSPAGEAVPA